MSFSYLFINNTCYLVMSFALVRKIKNIARNLLSFKNIPGRTELEGLRNLKNKIEGVS